MATATGLVAAGAALFSIGWHWEGLALLSAAASMLIALPFAVFLNQRVAVATFGMSILAFSIGIGDSYYSRPPRALWCNQIGPSRPVAYVSADSQHGSGLQLVRVLANEEFGQPGCVKVDLSLLNSGNKGIFVERVGIQILRSWPVYKSCPPGGKGGGSVRPASNYNTTLRLDRVPSVSYVDNVSQRLAAQDDDRFTITARIVGNPAGISVATRILEARVNVYYNGTSATGWSRPFLFLSDPRPALVSPELRDNFGEPAVNGQMNPVIGPHVDLAFVNHQLAVKIERLSAVPTGEVMGLERFLLARIIPPCPG